MTPAGAVSEPIDACKVVIQAKKLITDRKHWVKGSLRREAQGATGDYDTPQFCLLGALSEACGLDTYNDQYPRDVRGIRPVLKAIARQIKTKQGGDFLHAAHMNSSNEDLQAEIYRFNDRDCTNHTDVLDVLAGAIDELCPLQK